MEIKSQWNNSQTTGRDVLNDIRRAKHAIENDVGYVPPPRPSIKQFHYELIRLLSHEPLNCEMVFNAWEMTCQKILELMEE